MLPSFKNGKKQTTFFKKNILYHLQAVEFSLSQTVGPFNPLQNTCCLQSALVLVFDFPCLPKTSDQWGELSADCPYRAGLTSPQSPACLTSVSAALPWLKSCALARYSGSCMSTGTVTRRWTWPVANRAVPFCNSGCLGTK